DRYNRTGFIDQSEARATRQAPSIRVHHAGHVAHYILHLIHVLLWLAAFLSRMPLDRRGTRDWLRPGGPICLRPHPTPQTVMLNGIPDQYPLKKRRSNAEQWYGSLVSKLNYIPKNSLEIWSDLYSPKNLKDIAIHHDKLREITEVCTKAKAQKKGIVVLTGPPGCSKSTCLLAVCRSLGYQPPLRWEEVDLEGEDIASNELQHFEEFLLRSARYSVTGSLDANSISLDSQPFVGSPQVVLIENLPYGLSDQPSRFHNYLRLFLAQLVVPTLLAFVFTKSSSASSAGTPGTSSFDNLTLNRLFPPDIKQELAIERIDFNPIAPSIMLRALTRIVGLVSKENGIAVPPKSFIQRLVASSSGDIRLAMNSLQFSMMRGSCCAH
uniref:AAA_5 domain-containing protein n=1 Tax=Mesocestoides corti TaxID=53468 RepID=A0A5K3FFG0_MESCO